MEALSHLAKLYPHERDERIQFDEVLTSTLLMVVVLAICL